MISFIFMKFSAESKAALALIPKAKSKSSICGITARKSKNLYKLSYSHWTYIYISMFAHLAVLLSYFSKE